MSFLSSLEADLKSWADSIEGVVESAGKQEATLVANTLATAIPALAESEVTALASGTLSQQGAVVGKLITSTAATLESQSAQVGITAIVSGVQTSVASIQSAASAVSTAAEEPTPPAAA